MNHIIDRHGRESLRVRTLADTRIQIEGTQTGHTYLGLEPREALSLAATLIALAPDDRKQNDPQPRRQALLDGRGPLERMAFEAIKAGMCLTISIGPAEPATEEDEQ